MIEAQRPVLNVDWNDPALAPYYRAVETIDPENREWVRALVTRSGWPVISAVGRDGLGLPRPWSSIPMTSASRDAASR